MTITYNPQGYTLSITYAFGQPEAQTTTYEWQATTNLLLSVTDALARKTAYTYDAKGNVLTVTRLATTPNAVTTTMTYELLFNQVATVKDPLNHTTTFGYDATGNLTTITTFTYEAGDLVKVKDPLNRETQRILVSRPPVRQGILVQLAGMFFRQRAGFSSLI